MTYSVPTLINQEGVEHALTDRCIVGRSDDCDIQLDSGKVSRHHARFVVDADGKVLVEDLGSSNGTFVNGSAITATAPSPLAHSDRVSIDRFQFTLQLPGAEEVPDPDATVIGRPDDQATVIGTAEPVVTPPSPVAAEDADADVLPGSWVEADGGDGTRLVSAGALAAARLSQMRRYGDMPQIIVLNSNGTTREVVELETAGGDIQDVWEIGRQDDCDVILDDPTVSSRHAQLVHQNGRWRMVNLISSNGIVVNGERRLSVYLDDGDTVELGGTRLVFYAAVDASPAKRATPKVSMQRILLLTAAAVTLLVAAAAVILLLR